MKLLRILIVLLATGINFQVKAMKKKNLRKLTDPVSKKAALESTKPILDKYTNNEDPNFVAYFDQQIDSEIAKLFVATMPLGNPLLILVQQSVFFAGLLSSQSLLLTEYPGPVPQDLVVPPYPSRSKSI